MLVLLQPKSTNEQPIHHRRRQSAAVLQQLRLRDARCSSLQAREKEVTEMLAARDAELARAAASVADAKVCSPGWACGCVGLRGDDAARVLRPLGTMQPECCAHWGPCKPECSAHAWRLAL